MKISEKLQCYISNFKKNVLEGRRYQMGSRVQQEPFPKVHAHLSSTLLPARKGVEEHIDIIQKMLTIPKTSKK